MRRFFLLVFLFGLPAWATPQISIRSSARCDSCHVQPTGWYDPADIFQRKCTLSCSACHVAPTGGALRNAAGRYHAAHSLPMFQARAAEVYYEKLKQDRVVMPATELHVPPAGTAARFGGIEPNPTLQVGADVRLALYRTLGAGGETAVFPMQTDLQLAWRPYNPRAQNEGRITLLVNAGSRGSRGEAFDGFTDRAFVREWYAMYGDLPAHLYVRAGRFLPAHGWRTDDHTHFTRQRQQIFGQGWDFERQVTGIEVGASTQHPYVHLSVFNPADQWDEPIDADQGLGTALTAGWRDFFWQAGGSLAYGRKDGDQVVASGELAFNFERLTGLPLLYLGQYMVNHRASEAARSFTGLSAFHELGAWVVQGLNLRLRYDWADPDIEVAFDSGHQLTLGIDFHPLPSLEVIAQYRHAWTNTADRLALEGDALLLLLHAYY